MILGLGDSFLDTIPIAQVIKEIIDQLEFIKIKNVLQRTPPEEKDTNREKIFASHMSLRHL